MQTIVEEDEIEDLEVVEEIVNVEAYTTHFHGDIRVLAEHHLVSFFSNQDYFCGGKIPENLLVTEKNISIAMNTNIEDGFPYAYKCIRESGTVAIQSDPNFISDDVKLVISILLKCAKAGVPREMATGLVLLYLEFCEGIDTHTQEIGYVV